MNSLLGPFSRRTFLGGASLAAAHAATPHLPRAPLSTEIFLDDELDLPALLLVCEAANLRTERITVRTPQAFSRVVGCLAEAGRAPVVINSLETRPARARSICEANIVLGRWMGGEPDLATMLRTQVPLYCDDATLAFRLQTIADKRHFARRSLIGLDAVLDPLIDFVAHRMHAGLIGRLRGFSATIPRQHGILAIEAAFIAGRFDPSRKAALALIETSNAPPMFALDTSDGGLQIHLFCAAERKNALKDRLVQFESVARGETVSCISIQGIVENCAHLQRLL